MRSITTSPNQLPCSPAVPPTPGLDANPPRSQAEHRLHSIETQTLPALARQRAFLIRTWRADPQDGAPVFVIEQEIVWVHPAGLERVRHWGRNRSRPPGRDPMPRNVLQYRDGGIRTRDPLNPIYQRRTVRVRQLATGWSLVRLTTIEETTTNCDVFNSNLPPTYPRATFTNVARFVLA